MFPCSHQWDCLIIFIPAHCNAKYDTISRNHRFTTLANKVTESASEAGINRALNETLIINSGNPKNVTPTVCNVPVKVKTIKTLSIGTGYPNAIKDKEITEISQIKLRIAQTAGLINALGCSVICLIPA
jgi:hypothetical protein